MFFKVFMIFTGLETASVSKSNPPFMFMSFLKMFVKIVKIVRKLKNCIIKSMMKKNVQAT